MPTRPALTVLGSALAFSLGGVSAAHAADDTAATSAAPAAPSAMAAVPTLPALPPAGSALPLTEDGDMVLACNGTLHRVDLRGTGRLDVGGKVAAPDATSGVALTTTSEDLTGYDPVLGTVTVTEAAPATGEISSPVSGETFPAAQSFAQNVTVSMEHSPCDDSGEPVTFQSTVPFTLLNGNLREFPPQNAVYVLPEPVTLTQESGPDLPPATLLQFPVTVTHDA